jgi:RHS repeat-associated protein
VEHLIGEVVTSTGTLPPARFPGQWFQSESGLHQNWMRDYDPTTGRYLEPDPLGLIDGASVYGYVGQNPMIRIDPWGEESTRVYRLPEDPANLGPDWNPFTGHLYGQTFEHRCSPAKLEFHPGNAAEGGWGADDHYHYYPSGRQRVKDRAWGGTGGDHFVPGDFVEVTDCSCPEDFEEDPVTHLSLLFLLFRGPIGWGVGLERILFPVTP